MTAFEEDSAACELAARLGLSLSRFESIEITDEAAIRAAGLMCQTPDYPRIRKLLANDATVPGVRVGAVEYKLRRPTA